MSVLTNHNLLFKTCALHLYVLYDVCLYSGEKCISCKGHWFTPRQFEKFGGKGHHKKWKSSIYYKPSNGLKQVQLEKLIQVCTQLVWNLSLFDIFMSICEHLVKMNFPFSSRMGVFQILDNWGGQLERYLVYIQYQWTSYKAHKPENKRYSL